MPGYYTESQSKHLMAFNLGAAVSIALNEAWYLFTVPSSMPEAEITEANLGNGANVTANATDFNVFTLVKNGNVTMGTLNVGVTNLVADTGVAFTMAAAAN